MTTAENIPVMDSIHPLDGLETQCTKSSHVQVSPYLRYKGPLDRVLAALLLIPSFPIIGILIVLVRLTSPGPGVFRQTRVGRNGKLFTMYKLRSMRCDAEVHTGAVWTQPGDARLTSIGRVLRKLHLDELPQLVNVLRGEMSLIGPRPERPEFVVVLEQHIAGYRDRLVVLPGITGLAQINLPPDTDLISVQRKQLLDLEYIRTASLLLDLRMLLSTMLRMFGLKGSVVMRLMALQRDVNLSANGFSRLTRMDAVAPEHLVGARDDTCLRSDNAEAKKLPEPLISTSVRHVPR